MKMNTLFDLTGKVALVTGGSTGLGEGMALGLAQAGADVFLVDHHERTETAEKVKTIGRKAGMIVSDLAAQGEPARVVKACVDTFGRLDILVNNAGIIRRTPAIDFAEKDWDDVMGLNAKAVFLLSQEAARVMLKQGGGKIINVASLLSFSGGLTVPSYAASKGAVAQLTKALANEWASQGINVNAIAPGYMETSNTEALRKNAERMRTISDRLPAGRWGKPEDLAGAAVFLASKASDYVHGHVLVVDGGWMAR